MQIPNDKWLVVINISKANKEVCIGMNAMQQGEGNLWPNETCALIDGGPFSLASPELEGRNNGQVTESSRIIYSREEPVIVRGPVIRRNVGIPSKDGDSGGSNVPVRSLLRKSRVSGGAKQECEYKDRW